MRALLTIFASVFCFVMCAQPISGPRYSRVKINTMHGAAQLLPATGLDLTHGFNVPGRFYINDLAEWEIDNLDELGLEYEILIDDVAKHYVDASSQRQSQADCQDRDLGYYIPENFTFGSMSGYLTYQEILDQLDHMRAAYPGLISVRKQVGTTETHQGRQINWVRISDQASVDEDEPEILYTALHHAREPMSMTQMMYFMWYLLERYGTDPEIKYLVNNTELYFIPCINPDGYIYNQTIEPNGGGLWRKNMRDNNGDGTFDPKDDGVDLNRNYGFQWGIDNDGSSQSPGSSVYRGPEAFSEPETRAVREFVAEHDFLLALNYHSYGNFLIYPWGFDGTQSADSAALINFAKLLSLENGYKGGTPPETVGYVANGICSDWMHGDHGILAITPEVGNPSQGFWPPQDDILHLCQANLQQNLRLAHLVHQYALATDVSKGFFTTRSGEIDITVERFGMQSGTMALSVTSADPMLQISGMIHEVSSELFVENRFAYTYTISPDAIPGDAFAFVIKIDNGFFEIADTITKVLASDFQVFNDAAANVDRWNLPAASAWGITSTESHSGGTSFTDSPASTYARSHINEMVMNEPIHLDNAIEAELQFYAKWDIEPFVDYALVQASTDGIFFENLCGKYTKAGSIFQLDGEPVYDGLQEDWVEETIDLSAYIGQAVYLRFVMVSDAYFEADGIYIDDVRVTTYEERLTAVTPIAPELFEMKISPNPVVHSDFISIELPSVLNGGVMVIIYDALGRPVSRFLAAQSDNLEISTRTLSNGTYFISAHSEKTRISTARIVIAR